MKKNFSYVYLEIMKHVLVAQNTCVCCTHLSISSQYYYLFFLINNLNSERVGHQFCSLLTMQIFDIASSAKSKTSLADVAVHVEHNDVNSNQSVYH